MLTTNLKKLLSPILFAVICFHTMANELSTDGIKLIGKMRVVSNNQQLATIQLFDNAASRQLLAQLPLTLNFSDFAHAEKVAYLPNKLTPDNTPTAQHTPTDFTYYHPAGDVALFYNSFTNDIAVYALGRIETGKETLANIPTDFTATLEKIND